MFFRCGNASCDHSKKFHLENMRECVAAFIVRDKKILLGKRSAKREFYPGIWDVFGGHRIENEACDDALRRELLEELGIVPTALSFLVTVEEPNPAENGDGLYHFYLVTDFCGEARNLQTEEHEIIEWFNSETALKLPFVHPLYAEVIAEILPFESF